MKYNIDEFISKTKIIWECPKMWDILKLFDRKEQLIKTEVLFVCV